MTIPGIRIPLTSRARAKRSWWQALETLESRVLLTGTTYTILNYPLNGNPDGAGPFAELSSDGAGDLFGTAANNGINGDGTIFELPAHGGQLSILHSFAGGA